MGSKNDTVLGQDCNTEVKTAKNNATFVCPCAVSLAEHMDLLITRTLESLINLTNSLKISKNVVKTNKQVIFFVATSKLQGEILAQNITGC